MMDEKEERQRIIRAKCPYCFKKDWCMCLPSQRADCLGPFKDEDDNSAKFREWAEKEAKPKANMKGYVSEHDRDLYRANIDLLKHRRGNSSGASDEDD